VSPYIRAPNFDACYAIEFNNNIHPDLSAFLRSKLREFVLYLVAGMIPTPESASGKDFDDDQAPRKGFDEIPVIVIASPNLDFMPKIVDLPQHLKMRMFGGVIQFCVLTVEANIDIPGLSTMIPVAHCAVHLGLIRRPQYRKFQVTTSTAGSRALEGFKRRLEEDRIEMGVAEMNLPWLDALNITRVQDPGHNINTSGLLELGVELFCR
jgi:hypothetical protein